MIKFPNSVRSIVNSAFDECNFEYMLGELLDIFEKSVKGQLIFTSHNLRALEMLDKKSITLGGQVFLQVYVGFGYNII